MDMKIVNFLITCPAPHHKDATALSNGFTILPGPAVKRLKQPVNSAITHQTGLPYI
jgi:hypothetical protein